MKTSVKNLRLLIPVAASVFALAALFVLVQLGYIRLYEPNRRYAVRGVDVSSYQGDVNWAMLGEQGIKFAYIKATEGSSHVDDCFIDNWSGANTVDGLAVGAYHFMSFESSGSAQAQNFISNVPKSAQALPPAVDLELYGDYVSNPPSVSETREILDELLSSLEAHYGKAPVIYVNRKMYQKYLGDGYSRYPVWICDIYGTPKSDIPWTFWQYSHIGKLAGHGSDAEEHIDLNVFYSDEQALFDLTS